MSLRVIDGLLAGCGTSIWRCLRVPCAPYSKPGGSGPSGPAGLFIILCPNYVNEERAGSHQSQVHLSAWCSLSRASLLCVCSNMNGLSGKHEYGIAVSERQ